MRQSTWPQSWLDPAFPLGLMRIRGARESDAHGHPFHEIVVVAEGAIEQRHAGGRMRQRPGQILIMHPQAWHSFRSTRDALFYNCLFMPSLLSGYPALFRDLSGAFTLFSRRHPRPVAEPPVALSAPPHLRGRLCDAVEEMVVEQESARPGWQVALLARLVGFLVTIGRLAEEQQGPLSRSGADVGADLAIRRSAARLETSFREELSLDDLAAEVALSPCYLSRRFRACMGMGVSEYRNALRVEEACRRLILGDDSITEVALAVGFNDSAYFARIFKRLLGCTPRQYRRRGGD